VIILIQFSVHQKVDGHREAKLNVSLLQEAHKVLPKDFAFKEVDQLFQESGLYALIEQEKIPVQEKLYHHENKDDKQCSKRSKEVRIKIQVFEMRRD